LDFEMWVIALNDWRIPSCVIKEKSVIFTGRSSHGILIIHYKAN